MANPLITAAVALALFANNVPAQAWTAVAYGSDNGMTYMQYRAKSPDEAEREALAGCSRHARACSLIGETVDGPIATMLVRGSEGIARGSSANPEEALNMAMQECGRKSGNCRLVAGAWDGGTSMLAIAIDTANAWAGTVQPTAEEARAAALDVCRQKSRVPDNCKIYHNLTSPGWIAIARAENATGIGVSVRSSELASTAARRECEKASLAAGGSGCGKVEIFHNGAGLPEPANYQQVVSTVKRDRMAITASVPPFIPKK